MRRSIQGTLAILFFLITPKSFAECARPYMFFDLGETLVDTETTNFQSITYMPGAYQYLRDLQANGYPIGMLINIPEDWGTTNEEKVAQTKKFIEGRWVDKDPMDWEMFTAGIFVPPSDARR